jgi:hypothetical protein
MAHLFLGIPTPHLPWKGIVDLSAPPAVPGLRVVLVARRVIPYQEWTWLYILTLTRGIAADQ